MEIERKFVVGEPLTFDLAAYASEPISQGYIAIADDGTEVRIRARGHTHTLTVKSGPARSRVEEEIEIDARRFESLWPLTDGRRVEKRRYVIPGEGDLGIELDVYEGDLAGLVTAEVEFPSEEAADAFDPPTWLGTDVTGDARYSNQSLATRGLPA
jgi:CYTH domain-containing protein